LTESGDYVLGHSAQELERLNAQARLVGPITRRFLQEAGVVAGMRVLDVGSGAGDVALLAAELVGNAGEVVGVDRSAEALSSAAARAAAASLSNVSFLVGDPAEMVFDRPFDAVVGRYVLQFQADPAAMLARLAGHVRPGGLVVFHELDWAGARSFPPASIFDNCRKWMSETIRLSGAETHMGARLHATFTTAGLSAPTMRLEALIGGGERASSPLQLMAALASTLLPAAERLGVDSSAAADPETLLERMTEEVCARNALVIGLYQIGAWSRV
jgi:2-polyprenyl-3-methyl-5-hydroxy-6-metoxy-1,4-benzoquinol methylase